MKIIGLTGGIGTGKSTVSAILGSLGAVILDADKVGHETLKSDAEVRQRLVNMFGSGIIGPDNEIDRASLAAVVFNDPDALAALNKIMHPRILSIVKQKFEEWRSQGVDVVVLEVALLLEAKWTANVDEVWVTIASEDTVIRRIGSRSGFTEEQTRARIRSQMSTADRIKQADVVINTDCELSQVESEIKKLWESICSTDVRG